VLLQIDLFARLPFSGIAIISSYPLGVAQLHNPSFASLVQVSMVVGYCSGRLVVPDNMADDVSPSGTCEEIRSFILAWWATQRLESLRRKGARTSRESTSRHKLSAFGRHHPTSHDAGSHGSHQCQSSQARSLRSRLPQPASHPGNAIARQMCLV